MIWKRVHFFESVLPGKQLLYILTHAIEQKVILLLLDATDWQFAKYFSDCFKLTQVPQRLICFTDHLFDKFIFSSDRLPAFLLDHAYLILLYNGAGSVVCFIWYNKLEVTLLHGFGKYHGAGGATHSTSG